MVSETSEINSSHKGFVDPDLSLRHLQAELARIDLLVQREVHRWQLAGQDPNDAFRGLYVSDAQAQALILRPLGFSWGDAVDLEADELAAYGESISKAELQVKALRNAARCQGQALRLECLAESFDLDRFDVDTLLICLAPALDQRYEKLYGYLQDDITRKRPSVNLVLNLLCEPGSERLLYQARFSPENPLIKQRIIQIVPEPGQVQPPLLQRTLSVDETIVAWLLGKYRPSTEFSGYPRLSHPQLDPVDELLSGEKLNGFLEQTDSHLPPILFFSGPDLVAQEAAARMAASQWKRPLLEADLAAAVKAEIPLDEALRLVLRDARLIRAVPLLKGWAACFEDGAPSGLFFEQLSDFPDWVILTGKETQRAKGMQRSRRLVWQEFPIPGYARRCRLWEHFLGGVQDGLSNISYLAGQFNLTTSQIRDAVAYAQDLAVQKGKLLTEQELLEAARAYSNPNLASLARKLTPRYRWEDIILPDDQLDLLSEIADTVRSRQVVLQEWGVGRKLAASQGITILFAGPPGTGKTMAAEILAGALSLELYKIDLSMVVSKYVGETEKNLEHIFSEAESSNAILFFDEADALFGKRSEVRDSHDRYANIEISYLLQRMEAYDGVTILATNLRANLDAAFTRRLQFAVDFPFPKEQDRLRIWQALFPADLPRTPGLDFCFLAQRFNIAGGSIRNIIVNAAYLAANDGQCVTMEHLLHGARRELQKMGRLIDEEALTWNSKQTS